MFGHYQAYLREREGKEILECPEGFATYRVLGEECYLIDIYVKPEFRLSGIAKSIANDVCSIAKESGCKWLTGSVSPPAKGSHESLLVLLAYGMKLLRSEKDLVYFVKEI